MDKEKINNMTDEEKEEFKNNVLELWECIKKAMGRIIKEVVKRFKIFVNKNEKTFKKLIVYTKAKKLYKENKPIESIKIKRHKKLEWKLLKEAQ